MDLQINIKVKFLDVVDLVNRFEKAANFKQQPISLTWYNTNIVINLSKVKICAYALVLLQSMNAN